MPTFDSELSAEALEQHKKAVDEFNTGALDQIKNILSRIPDESLQRRVYEIALSGQTTLSDQRRRPHLTAAYYSDVLYRKLATEPTDREELVQFAITVQEYYDILDDAIDGDIDRALTTQALATAQALLPVLVQLLGELEGPTTIYWSKRAVRLTEVPMLEAELAVSKANYMRILRRQSNLWGFVTGLAAMVAGADEQVVARSEALGRALYKVDATWTDCGQYEREEDLKWNMYTVFGVEEVQRMLDIWCDIAWSHIEQLPTDDERLLKTPLVQNIENWNEHYPSLE